MDSDISNIIFHLVGLGVLLSLSAFFSGSETALFSLSKAQIEGFRQSSSKRDRFVAELLSNPRRLLISILVGNMFVNVASASLVASFATALLGNEGIGIAIGVSTVLLLIFGEITPKTVAVHNSEPFSKVVAYPLSVFSKLIFPIRSMLSSITNFLMRAINGDNIPIEDRITTEELKAVVEAAKEEGSIEQQEKDMIETIFDLRDITAAEIMVPRTEIICAPEESTLQQVFDMACLTGHSRIPLYKGDIDNIFGIAYIKDFPIWRHHHINSMTIQEFLNKRGKLWPRGKDTLIRPPFFAPETRTAIGLLQDFRENRVQIAILLDEYGGTAGLVTMEDLVEELVGEITNDDSKEHGDFRPIDEFTTIVFGRASIRNVNKKLDLNLPPEEDVDTIGGYVISLMGRIPEKGEKFSANGVEFEVVGVDGRRITEVLVRKIQDLTEEESEGEKEDTEAIE